MLSMLIGSVNDKISQPKQLHNRICWFAYKRYVCMAFNQMGTTRAEFPVQMSDISLRSLVPQWAEGSLTTGASPLGQAQEAAYTASLQPLPVAPISRCRKENALQGMHRVQGGRKSSCKATHRLPRDKQSQEALNLLVLHRK